MRCGCCAVPCLFNKFHSYIKQCGWALLTKSCWVWVLALHTLKSEECLVWFQVKMHRMAEVAQVALSVFVLMQLIKYGFSLSCMKEHPQSAICRASFGKLNLLSCWRVPKAFCWDYQTFHISFVCDPENPMPPSTYHQQIVNFKLVITSFTCYLQFVLRFAPFSNCFFILGYAFHLLLFLAPFPVIYCILIKDGRVVR